MAVYYVSTSGSDSNPGTEDSPFRTPSRGCAPLRAGDTLWIRGGTYTDQFKHTSFTAEGTASAPILIAGYPNETVTILNGWLPNIIGFGAGERQYIEFQDLILDGSTVPVGYGVECFTNNLTFRRVTIRHCYKNGVLGGGSGHRFLDCIVHSNGREPFASYNPGHNGLYLACDNTVVRGVWAYNNAGYGIRMVDSAAGHRSSNNVIERCRAYLNGNGIGLDGDSESGSGGGGIVIGDTNNVVRNCLVYGNLTGIEITGLSGKSAEGCKLFNNSIYGNSNAGIRVGVNAGANNTEIKNNILWLNGQTITYVTHSGTVEATNLTTDPSFTNAPAGDFTLLGGSAAIDTGTPITSVADDYLGNTRPFGANYDIGAIESGATGGGPPPIGPPPEPPIGGGAADPTNPVNVQRASGGNTVSAASFTITLPSPTTAGNLIVVGVMKGIATPWLAGNVTDNVGNVYELADGAETITATVRAAAIYYCRNCIAGATVITVTYPAATTGSGGATEWSDCKTSSDVLDATGTCLPDIVANRQTGATSLTTQAKTLLVGIINIGPFTTDISVEDPAVWTQEYKLANRSAMYSRITDDIGHWSCRFYFTGTETHTPCGVIAAFKAVTAGTPSTPGPNVNPVQPILFRGVFDENTPDFVSYCPITTGATFPKHNIGADAADISRIKVLTAGTFKNLVVTRDAPVVTGSFTYIVRKNLVDTALSVRFTGAQLTRRNVERSFHANAGDTLCFSVLGEDDPDLGGFDPEQISIDFEPDVAGENFYGWATSTNLGASTQWNGVFAGVSRPNTVSGSVVQNIVAVAGQIEALYVRLTAAPGGVTSRTFTLYRNGVIQPATALTISGTSTEGTLVLGTPLQLSPGELVWLESTVSGAPVAAQMSFSMKYKVNVNGQSQFTSCAPHNTGATNNRYQRINGGTYVSTDTWKSVATNVDALIPCGPTRFTLSGLQVKLDGDPGASPRQYAIRGYRNGVPDTSLQVVLPTGLTAGNSGSGFMEVVDGDDIMIESEPSATDPTARHVTFAMIVTTELAADDADLTATLDGVGELFEEETKFEADESPIGETWLEFTDSNGTLHVWSLHALPDPAPYYGGWKEPRVIEFGTIRRSLSDDLGEYEGTTFVSTLSDNDRVIRALLGAIATKYFPNRTVAVRSITDGLRRKLAAPRTLLRGLVREQDPGRELTFDLTVQDSFASRFSQQSEVQLPKRVIGPDFPNAPTALGSGSNIGKTYTTPHSSITPCVGYVQLSDQAAVICVAGVGINNGTYDQCQDPGWTMYDAAGATVNEGWAGHSPPIPGDVVFASAGVATALEAAAGGTTKFSTVGLAVPFIYGTIDEAPLVYVGRYTLPDTRSYHKWVVCGHAVKGIDGLRSNNGDTGIGTSPASAVGDLAVAAGSGADWVVPGFGAWTALFGASAPLYEDINGRRYTVIYGLVGNREADIGAGYYDPLTPDHVRLSVSVRGVESVGDGSGELIIDLLEQYRHATKNVVFGDYQSGNWLVAPTFPDDPTLSMIDEQSFTDASNCANRRTPGGYYGDFIIGHTTDNATSDFVTVRQLIARFNVSADVNSGFNRKGQFFVSMIDDANAAPDTVMDITDVRDIHQGTFHVDEDQAHHFNVVPFRHTRDYVGREKDGWRSIHAGTVELTDDISITQYGPPGQPMRLPSPLLELHMIRGRNVEADLPLYERGTATGTDVVGRFLLRHKDPPRLVSFQMGHHGNNADLGELVRVKHLGNVRTGWSRMRVERHEAAPGQYTVDFTVREIEGLLESIAVLGDETLMADTWLLADLEDRQFFYLGDETTGTFTNGDPMKRLT